MIFAQAGTTFEAAVITGVEGEAAALTWKVVDPDTDEIVLGPTTGATESGVVPGTYSFSATAPSPGDVKTYWVVWTGGSIVGAAIEELEVTLDAPLIPGQDFIANPTVQDVADLLVSRTRTPGGALAGTFTDETTPTEARVQRLISSSHRSIASKTGPIPNTLLSSDATEIIALYTAMKIELGHYSEQVNTNRSPYKEIKELFNEQMKALIEGLGGEGDSAVDDLGLDGQPTEGTPFYDFPPTSIGDGIMP